MASRTLHVYGQVTYHDDVYVMGNRGALTALRDQIQRALDTQTATSDAHFVNDGEGYDIKVALCSDKQMAVLMDPYTESIQQEGVAPYVLLRKI